MCTAPVGGVSAAVRPAGPPCRVRAATQGPRPPLQTRDRGYFTTSTSFFFFTTNTCFLDVLNSISRYLLLCFPRSTETEAISQSAPEFGRMSRICGLRMSFPNSLQYYTDGGRCHCCRPKEFFSSQKAPVFWMSLLNSISRYLLLCFPRSTNLKELRRPFHHHPRHCQRLYGPRRYLLRLIQKSHDKNSCHWFLDN